MPNDALFDRLLPKLYRLRQEALAAEAAHADALALIEPCNRPSARNLIHYLSVRRHDIRSLQKDLMSIGLSSLGVIEPHTLASLDHVIYMLELLKGIPHTGHADEPADLQNGPLLLRDNATALLGPESDNRAVRIMVTMPTEAASDPRLIEDLLRAGMNIMRINCAHDSPEAWQAMVDNLRKAEGTTGLSCLIQADLAGPKVRTGPIRPVGRIRKYRPQRDAFGRLLRPARVLIQSSDMNNDPAVVPLGPGAVEMLDVGDQLVLRDARGRKRRIEVVGRTENGLVAEIEKTTYLTTGMSMRIRRGGDAIGEATVGELPEVSEPLLLDPGDALILKRAPEAGRPALRDGEHIEPARIHCTLSEAFDLVAEGEPVWFDDGRIGGIVSCNDGDEMLIDVTHTAPEGSRLKAGKGINFPETNLDIDALTRKDIRDLEAVVSWADMVALSFLRRPEDVLLLEEQLTRLDGQHIGVVLKIENRQALENLPSILLASLRSPPVGVMVARGDLAVEVGFERLSEVQEEILWVCEAAHVPVIWATQVLEGLAKTGAPSRAEVTDAAASQRAECVMLNKGPHIVETTRFLADVLSRMGAHNRKRRATLRKLSIAQSFKAPPEPSRDS